MIEAWQGTRSPTQEDMKMKTINEIKAEYEEIIATMDEGKARAQAISNLVAYHYADTVRIHYGEYKSEYDGYLTVEGSYDTATKTIEVLIPKSLIADLIKEKGLTLEEVARIIGGEAWDGSDKRKKKYLAKATIIMEGIGATESGFDFAAALDCPGRLLEESSRCIYHAFRIQADKRYDELMKE